MRHINIPIFIPHLGCPNACVFCNQKKISGVNTFSIDTVRKNIEQALSTVCKDDEVEIAFFGGSFTAIDRNLMVELLKIGKRYMDEGLVSALRCSTRPDAIDCDVLTLLRDYGMKTIELGMQSASENVLMLSERGHTFSQTVYAAELIKSYGFDLVLQMMLGLPGASHEDELYTAEQIVALGADAVRIYPTVVFYETKLCQMAKTGEYTPLSVQDAVKRASGVLRILNRNHIPVIRMGLCASDTLSSTDEVYAGVNHPAFGELVYSELYFEELVELLKERTEVDDEVTVYVNFSELSRAIGHKKKNKLRLMEMFCLKDLRFVERKLRHRQIVSLVDGDTVDIDERNI